MKCTVLEEAVHEVDDSVDLADDAEEVNIGLALGLAGRHGVQAQFQGVVDQLLDE